MLKAFDRIDMQATTERAVALARTTLQIESDAINALHARLATDDSVGRAVALLLQCKGRVVVSGIVADTEYILLPISFLLRLSFTNVYHSMPMHHCIT